MVIYDLLSAAKSAKDSEIKRVTAIIDS